MRAKELIEDPVLEDELPAAVLILAAQLVEKCLTKAEARNKTAGSDRLIEIDEAAERLKVSRSWLYRRSGKLPFAVHNGRRLAFSEKGIEEYIRRGMGRG
jgi:predicted DNA-binding transcriptional regulator AlpA